LALQVTNSDFNLAGLSDFLHSSIVVTSIFDNDHKFPTPSRVKLCVGLTLLAEAPFNTLRGVTYFNVDFSETITNHVGQIKSFISTHLRA